MARSSKSSTEDRARIFAALGDSRRLAIAETLVASHRTPGELMEVTGLSSSLLAHHLDILENAGVTYRIGGTADRRKRFIALVDSIRILLSPPVVKGPILFVCSQNSARSQLASAIWCSEVGGTASSAGTNPASAVHPLAIEVASGHGVDLSKSRPRRLTDSGLRNSTVITVCDQAHDEIPNPLRRLHWSIPDPAISGRKRDFESTYNQLSKIIKSMKGNFHVI